MRPRMNVNWSRALESRNPPNIKVVQVVFPSPPFPRLFPQAKLSEGSTTSNKMASPPGQDGSIDEQVFTLVGFWLEVRLQ